MTNPSDEEIRGRARQLWKEHGKVGHEEEFWNQAERQLQGIEERGDIMKASPDESQPDEKWQRRCVDG